ncbi:hypothetical protein [Natrinema salinisoli]|uniref:hypothetical protein n=1 Tax=Natrinema salinisoli TaxID=2878535 RepID=UPI001CF0AF30|nr:hypothetical protein [Natrinema salinisoli]
MIEEISSAETILSEAVKIDGDGSGLTFRANKFLVAIGLNNKNGTDDGSRELSSDRRKNNWWGSVDGPEEATFNQDADEDGRSDVIGNATVKPFLRNPPGKERQGKGNGN